MLVTGATQKLRCGEDHRMGENMVMDMLLLATGSIIRSEVVTIATKDTKDDMDD